MKVLALWGMIALVLSGFFSCSAFPLTRKAHEPKRTTLAGDWSDAESLDRELKSVKGSEVVVPAAQLRKLVRRELEMREQCRGLSTQLDALKGVDLKGGPKGADDALNSHH